MGQYKKFFFVFIFLVIMIVVGVSLWLILNSLFPNTVSGLISKSFLCIMAVLFLLYIFNLLFQIERIEKFVNMIPSQLPALGILGTFLGIFIGLYKFDVNNIEKSVPLLLEGLKLAFSTSIAGLAGSLVLKIIYSIKISLYKMDSNQGQRSPENILLAINNTNKNMVEELKEIKDLLEQIYELYAYNLSQIISLFFMTDREFDTFIERTKIRAKSFKELLNFLEKISEKLSKMDEQV